MDIYLPSPIETKICPFKSKWSQKPLPFQCEYENGMFAADWVILKPNYIDEIFGKLRIFFDNYCESFYKEDLSRVSWDYEEYFNYAVEQMSHPFEYLGI